LTLLQGCQTQRSLQAQSARLQTWWSPQSWTWWFRSQDTSSL